MYLIPLANFRAATHPLRIIWLDNLWESSLLNILEINLKFLIYSKSQNEAIFELFPAFKAHF